MTGIKPLTIDGRNIPVEVTSDGQFVASYDPTLDKVIADSRNELEKRIRAKLRTKMLRVEVKITIIDKPSWRHEGKPVNIFDARLTGINAGNGHTIIVSNDGKVERRDIDIICRKLTEGEKKEYVAAWNQKNEAEQELDRMEQDWKINPDTVVAEAAARKDIERGA